MQDVFKASVQSTFGLETFSPAKVLTLVSGEPAYETCAHNDPEYKSKGRLHIWANLESEIPVPK